MDITKGSVPVRQVMKMDNKGAIYFVVKTETGMVKVCRVDPNCEMGNAGFVKQVYAYRCNDIYFLEMNEDNFYLMDDKKKIRVFTQDPQTFNL